MRLGWLLMPPWLGWQLVAAKAVEDSGSEIVSQLALCDFIVRGELDRHLRRMRRQYSSRRDALLQALDRWLGEAVTGHDPAGLYERVELPENLSEQALLAGAAARGVGVEGLALHSFTPGLVLGYGNLSEPAIEQGVRLLGEALVEVRESSS
jgi:GntR family transcriptional regulator/MocR family aminotransferase